jgi:SAM-dependent methyltransferase
VKATVVRLGARSLPIVFEESMRALWGRVAHIGRPGHLSRRAVQCYFERRSCNDLDDFADVTESSSWVYRRLITSSRTWATSLQSRHLGQVFDYGCGRAGLLRLLRDAGSQAAYLGFDIDRIAISSLSSLTQDPAAHFSAELPGVSCDLACAVNVLVYTPDADLRGVAADLVQSVRPGGPILIVEPYPAWYWETRFADLSLRLRSWKEVNAQLLALGRRPAEYSVAAVARIRGTPILPISWLGVWR